MTGRFKVFLARFRVVRWLVSLKNGGLAFLRGGYDPKRFWEGWADRFSSQVYQRELHESNRWLLDRMREARPTQIFEVGCGFGRNLKMLREGLGYPCWLAGMDVSHHLLVKVQSEVGGRVPLVCGDIRRLPLPDRAFEAVFTHGVLMHVPPQDIREAILELVRVTRKTLWCIEEYVPKRREGERSVNLNEYTFAHPYHHLFGELGVPVSRHEYLAGAVTLILVRVDVGVSQSIAAL
jgi:ubiquinone/menaquinone biosynthesis C-methylase UbiE